MPREATIHKVNPYELHGVRYFQILFPLLTHPIASVKLGLPMTLSILRRPRATG